VCRIMYQEIDEGYFETEEASIISEEEETYDIK
jgi:hypothetical protein